MDDQSKFKIYTKKGDDGTTGLIGPSRVKKSSTRINCLGEIDELNAVLGLIRTLSEKNGPALLPPILEQIQNALFTIGCQLAIENTNSKDEFPHLSQVHVDFLETQIDKISKTLPGLKSFILPGGCELNAYLHISRTICRRAERSVVFLNEAIPVTPLILSYLNRLSDLLFVMARYSCITSGAKEYLWNQDKE